MKVKIETSKQRRIRRVRSKLKGTATVPRVSVFRSLKYIYAQAINDENGKTIAAADIIKDKGMTKVEASKKEGEMFGDKLKKLKIKEIVFDRGGFKYHGRVKAFADGMRSAGIKF